MAVYNLSQLYEEGGYGSLNLASLENNTEVRSRLAEIAQSIANSSSQYRTMLSARTAMTNGTQFSALDQIVVKMPTELKKDNSGNLNRKIDINLSTQFAGGIGAIIPCAPDQNFPAAGHGGRRGISIEKEDMFFGTVRVTESESLWVKDVFSLDIWMQNLVTLETRLGMVRDILTRGTIFREAPYFLGETNGLPSDKVAAEFLPTFGEGANRTVGLKKFFPNGKTALDELTTADGITVDVLTDLEIQMKDEGIMPLAINGGVIKFGIILSTYDVLSFTANLPTTAQAMINSAFQSSQDFTKNPLYAGLTSPVLTGWLNWSFFINDAMSSDPTIIQYIDDAKKNITLPTLDPKGIAFHRAYKMAGTAFSPRARVLGLIDGTTALATKIEFDGEGNAERIALKAGTKTVNDKYLLIAESGGVNLAYFQGTDSGSTTIGADAIMAHPITATEAALNTCANMGVGKIAGIIQLGKATAANNYQKWKIVYTGPHVLGVMQKGIDATSQIIQTTATTIVDRVMALRIQAIYRWDNAANAFETTPVTNAELADEIAAIKLDLAIEADGFIKTPKASNGALQITTAIANRQTVSYFDAVRTLAFGQSVMYESLPIAGNLSGEERREFGMFIGRQAGMHIGQKLIVDNMTGSPLGAIQVIYKGAIA